MMELKHRKRTEGAELLIELIQACLEEDGYKVVSINDRPDMSTNAYESFDIEARTGEKFCMFIDRHVERREEANDGR